MNEYQSQVEDLPSHRPLNATWHLVLAHRDTVARLLLIALCLFGMLAGKGELSRLTILSAVMPGVEIRLLCIVASALVAALWMIAGNSIKLKDVDVWPFLAASPWIAMLFYAVVAGAVLWPAGSYGPYYTDLIYIIYYVITLSLVVRTRTEVVFTAIFLQIFALLILTVSFLHLGPDSYAYNHGEVVTTTTMYRIYGAGFCSSVFLLISSPNIWVKLAETGLSIALTFAMLSSTSKTSVIAIIAIIVTIAFFASVFARWKDLLLLIAIIGCGVVIFLNSGSAYMLTDRITAFGEDSLSEAPAADAQLPQITDLPQAIGCNPQQLAGLGSEVSIGPNTCIAQIVLSDPSERLRMLTHAFELFAQHPVFGAGPLGYNLALGDSDDLFVYTYAHNIFADALAKTGLVGTLFLLLALWILLVVCVRAVARQFDSIYLTCIPILYIAGAMTGGDLYDTRVGWAIAGAVGGAYGWRALTLKRDQIGLGQ
jgi:hypothetical protein